MQGWYEGGGELGYAPCISGLWNYSYFGVHAITERFSSALMKRNKLFAHFVLSKHNTRDSRPHRTHICSFLRV